MIHVKRCQENYCLENNIADPTSAGVNNIVNFLSKLCKKGLNFSSINGYRSAISDFHCRIDGAPAGQHHLVLKCLRGVVRVNPPGPKHATTWSISCVLDLLAGPSYNPNSDISLVKLKHKLAMLILVTTACRQSVLSRLERSSGYLVERGDFFILHPSGEDKNVRFTKKVHSFMIFDCPERPEISPFLCLKVFLARAPSSDPGFKSAPLFLSDFKNFRVSLNELRKWILAIMRAAGVPDQFAPHSIRSSVTSEAALLLESKEIMEAVDWKSEAVFHKFYLRNVPASKVEKRRAFQAAILN